MKPTVSGPSGKARFSTVELVLTHFAEVETEALLIPQGTFPPQNFSIAT